MLVAETLALAGHIKSFFLMPEEPSTCEVVAVIATAFSLAAIVVALDLFIRFLLTLS